MAYFVDQQQLSKGNAVGFGATTQDAVAQGFLPSVSGTITRVSVNVRATGTPTDNVVASIYSDNSGTPGTSLFTADNVVAGSSLVPLGTTGKELNFFFDNGGSLTAESRYWIYLNRSGALNDTNLYAVNSNQDDNYARGSLLYQQGAGTWNYDFDDAKFKTFYSKPVMSMRVSLPGYDANLESDIDNYSLYTDSDNILIKEKSRGTLGVTDGNNGTISHALGYIPLFLTYGQVATGRYRLISGFDPIGAGYNCYSGTSNIIVQNRSGNGTVVQYYVFYDNLP